MVFAVQQRFEMLNIYLYNSIYILLVFGCFEESIDIVSDGDGLVHQKIGCCLHVMHG